MEKCSFGSGIEMNIGGIPVDPCRYETTEIHRNVTVEVRKCVKCGHVDIAWHRQDDTESEMVVKENG